MERLLAEQSDTKSNVKLGGFDPSSKHPTCLATLKSCDTTKQSVCGWLYIYIYNLQYLSLYLIISYIYQKVTLLYYIFGKFTIVCI